MHVNTSFRPYSEGLQVTSGQLPYMGDMTPSSAESYYPSAYTAQSTWNCDGLTSNDDMNWSGVYDSTPTTSTWAPSVNPYTTYPTTSQAVSATSDQFYSNGGPFFSPYATSNPANMSSEDWNRPSLTRSVSADNSTNLTVHGSSSSSRMPSTAPVTPIEHQVSTSEYSSSQTLPPSKSKSKTTSKPTAKKRDSSSLKAKKEEKRVESAKRKIQPQIIPAPIPSTQEALDDYLISGFGLPLPDNARQLSSEQIRREAWRVCESQAKEMSERRMKLLEHEGGALERETRKLQLNVGLLRESILQEQRQLENALEIAERLSSASY